MYIVRLVAAIVKSKYTMIIYQEKMRGPLLLRPQLRAYDTTTNSVLLLQRGGKHVRMCGTSFLHIL